MSGVQLFKELERRGNWLFRRRSYIPLILLPFCVLAMAGSHYLPGLSPAVEFAQEPVCIFIALLGVVIRGASIGYALAGTSGRNTRSQVAESLNTSELYSIVRHPLYLGNLIMAASIMLYTRSVFFVAAGLLAYWVFYIHITAAEESYLLDKFGSAYSDWAARTPFLIPRFSLWRRSESRFSWSAAIRSEVYSLFALSTSFLVLNSLEHWFRHGRPCPHMFWQITWPVILVVWLVARYLRKHTHLLDSGPAAPQSV